jgi:hypothetical protein
MSGRPHSFLSPKCDVHPIPNRGGHTVVAREAIAKGELIVVWSGTLVSSEELNDMPPTVRRYSLQVEENQYLVSLSDCEPPDYVNHSCDPNSGLSGQITLVAMRDIQPGEEITYDYAMSDGSPYDEFSCSCGSPHCRGHVSGEDWRLPDLWRRYAGYFSPYLQRRVLATEALRALAVKRRRVSRKHVAETTVIPGE